MPSERMSSLKILFKCSSAGLYTDSRAPRIRSRRRMRRRMRRTRRTRRLEIKRKVTKLWGFICRLKKTQEENRE